MSFQILGFGTALPSHRMSQEDAASMSADLICRNDRQRRLLTTMMRRSQVDNRHTCIPHRSAYRWVADGASPGTDRGLSTQERMSIYAEHAGPLSATAARAALATTQTTPDQILHLVTVSCTGFVSPGFDTHLIETLGLPRGVQRTHVGYMGCHGALNGLRVASAMGRADPENRVLLCATELCSLHYRMGWDDERMLGNVLFADGSAAIVGTASAGIEDSSFRLRASGSCLVPDSSELMTWEIGDHGFEMRLSGQVPDAISRVARPWMDQWLASNNLTTEAVGCWAVHPGGPRILSAIEDSFELPSGALDVSRSVLKECGNMSSPTLLFILDRMAKQRLPRPCVAMAFGPGLTIEAAIFD